MGLIVSYLLSSTPGARSAYERFAAYVPRDGRNTELHGRPQGHTFRPRGMAVGRRYRHGGGGIVTRRGRLVGLHTALTRCRWSRATRRDSGGQGLPGSIPIMRFNHLYPPFDNPAIRRALLGAIDQADVMNAMAGSRSRVLARPIGLFGPGSPWPTRQGSRH